ncbi:MAG TPA: FG-GAP-like repeat-containing protein [Phycisphaerales bacterium]|nr:FG-GAP-like repeat-containing protein [Phycisphaerales bacterium]HMP37466.1 FG-GAP-like repeat-containing protein [Phycisphaerales bacterium]
MSSASSRSVSVAGLLLLASPAAAQIALEDRTIDANVLFVHAPDALAVPGPQEFMTSGIAVGDFNRDGWPDMFWASGGIGPDKLFINNGDGTFTDRAAEWGLTDVHAACGACAGDFDGDGWIDIYVTSFGNGSNNQGQVGKNRLYRNNGNGTFTNVAEQAGVHMTATVFSSGYGCAFGDYDLDGDLDLAVAAWFGPAQGNRLFRNNGDGTFTNVTGSAIVFPMSTWGFQTRFADMDHDGWPDLLLSADFGTSRYYRNNGDGTFTDLTLASNTGHDQNGMGQCIGDFNNDGRFDWYVTSIYLDVQQPNSGEGNKLYMNNGDHSYIEAAAACLVDDGGWGWGTVAVDLDHDGWIDIVEVNGRPLSPEFTGEQEYLWRNNGDGTFTEDALACGLTFQAEGKSLATLDYDRDGRVDLAIGFNADENRLYRNASAVGSWIAIELDTSNNPLIAPDGLGTRVEATVGAQRQVRLMDGAPAFLNTGEFLIHFGFGDAKVIDEIRIEWPRGYVSTLRDVPVNQFLLVTSPALEDLSADGVVDGADLALMIQKWGVLGTSADRKADLNNDGVVDSFDLGMLLGAWSAR